MVHPMGTDTLNVVHDPLSLNPWIPWFEVASYVCGVRHCGVVGPSVDLRECSVALVVGRAESWREIIETRHFVPFHPARRLPGEINIVFLVEDAMFALE